MPFCFQAKLFTKLEVERRYFSLFKPCTFTNYLISAKINSIKDVTEIEHRIERERDIFAILAGMTKCSNN